MFDILASETFNSAHSYLKLNRFW